MLSEILLFSFISSAPLGSFFMVVLSGWGAGSCFGLGGVSAGACRALGFSVFGNFLSNHFFINTFVFNKDNSSCNYYLKENNYDVDIEVKTINLDINDNYIYIKYIIVDSKCEYEYKLEMSDVK